MFRGTDILQDNFYTHVINGSQTCSSQNPISMSDVLSESIADCRTLQDVACSDHCAILVILNFEQLMSHNIERQRVRHINWN